MTKGEAKDWLERGWKLNETINKKLEEQCTIYNLACSSTSCPSNERVQSGHKNTTEDILIKYIDISDEIDRLTDELYDVKREILTVIKKVPNRFYRKILYWHCFCFKDWGWIAERTKMSKESIKKYHYIMAVETAKHYI